MASHTYRKRKRNEEEEEDAQTKKTKKTTRPPSSGNRKRKLSTLESEGESNRNKKQKLHPLPRLSTELQLLIHSFADVPEKRKMEKIMGWESPVGMGRVATPAVDLWEIKQRHAYPGHRAIIPLPQGKSYILSFPPVEEVLAWRKCDGRRCGTCRDRRRRAKKKAKGKRNGRGGKGLNQVHWILDKQSLLARVDEEHSLDYSMFICPPSVRQYAVSLHMVIMTVNVKTGRMDERVEIYDQQDEFKKPDVPTKYRGKLRTLNMKRIYRQPRRKCVKKSCC